MSQSEQEYREHLKQNKIYEIKALREKGSYSGTYGYFVMNEVPYEKGLYMLGTNYCTYSWANWDGKKWVDLPKGDLNGRDWVFFDGPYKIIDENNKHKIRVKAVYKKENKNGFKRYYG
jgi:hypothetical protein